MTNMQTKPENFQRLCKFPVDFQECQTPCLSNDRHLREGISLPAVQHRYQKFMATYITSGQSNFT